MPTYDDYLAYAKSKGFQPLGEPAFQKLIAAGLDPTQSRLGCGDGRTSEAHSKEGKTT